MRLYFLLIPFLFPAYINAQSYFPPVSGGQWDTVSPISLNWCISELDTLDSYLESRNTKSFIILHKGYIAHEKYFNGFGPDSLWYWASAGKSLIAFLTGIAQQEGFLNINDRTSDYLGSGWTSAPVSKEALITIRNQISMTTGLDFNVPDQNCLLPSCLNYRHDAGTHWYYYNAPYRLMQSVLDSATGKSLNVYTFQKLHQNIGMTGFWANHIFFSKARSMARFGLLNLNKGIWDASVILNDTAFFNAMTTSSQNLNPAYGYLWWLNGTSVYKQPGTDLVFNGPIIPTAPMDLYMAAGANDQRIYIVPALELVVVRQGNEAYSSQLALSQFDTELWELLTNLFCQSTESESYPEKAAIRVFPNPASDKIRLAGLEGSVEVEVWSLKGKFIKKEISKNGFVNTDGLEAGLYILKLYYKDQALNLRLLIR